MIYLDRLTLFSLLRLWLGNVFQGSGAPLVRFFYFNATRGGKFAFDIGQRLGLIGGNELDFSWENVRGRDGSNEGLRTEIQDSLILAGVLKSVFERDHLVSGLIKYFPGENALLFLLRSVVERAGPLLFRIKIVSWHHSATAGKEKTPPVYYALSAPWNPWLASYAQEEGILLKSQAQFSMEPILRLGSSAWRILRRACRAGINRIFRTLGERAHFSPRANSYVPEFRIGVAYHGKGIELDSGKNSDLFWVPFVGEKPQNILVYFAEAGDPLDEKKYTALKVRFIEAVALVPEARRDVQPPVWAGPSWAATAFKLGGLLLRMLPGLFASSFPLKLRFWVLDRALYFGYRYIFWSAFFKDFRIRINVDYNDWSTDRLAANQAMKELGGISVSYQRADEMAPYFQKARTSDVHFGFSSGQEEVEIKSGSRIKKFVAVGYPFDFAFSEVKLRSAGIRERLKEKGAEFILCYLDENSVQDKRKGPSHEFRAENYRYLLRKLLEDPSLGLIFKPKKAATLRRRLGPVAGLLDDALKTGRCHLFQSDSAIATPNLPSEAGLAADITVGLLCGSTAAIECALAGCRTVLLDREGLLFHPYYSIWDRTILFPSWEDLWRAMEAFRRDRRQDAVLGDWLPYRDIYDPFRDGKAARRIGNYIGWLNQGLFNGFSIHQAVERAQEKFEQEWMKVQRPTGKVIIS